MTVPLAILAFFSVVAGYVGFPAVLGEKANVFARFLEPVIKPAGERHLPVGTEWTLIFISVAVALLGIILAYLFYLGILKFRRRLAARFPAIYKLLYNKYYVDEIYGAVVVRPLVHGSDWIYSHFDLKVIDGTINGIGRRHGIFRQGPERLPDGIHQGLCPGLSSRRRHFHRSLVVLSHEHADSQPRHVPPAGRALSAHLSSQRQKKRALRPRPRQLTLVVFLVSLLLYFHFDSQTAGPQFVEKTSWLGYGIQYHLGIDGISLFLVLLTTFLMPIALLSSWSSIRDRIKEYLIFMLILETGIIGVFVSLNLFLFYVFWEAMLIPMYFLIGIWGGKRRIYATMKFVLFTMFGSLLMLVAIFVLYTLFYKATGTYSLNLFDFYQMTLDPKLQTWLFLAFTSGLRHQSPDVPVPHLASRRPCRSPDRGFGHPGGRPPQDGRLRLSAVRPAALPGRGREIPSRPVHSGLIGIIYGGMMALIQKDIKSLVAYSSVSHMGLVMLAIFSLNVEGTEGAIYQMLNHGLSTGALFLIVGILYERAHTRHDHRLRRSQPTDAGLLGFFSGRPAVLGRAARARTDSSAKSPALFGIFASNKSSPSWPCPRSSWRAAYLLWMFQRVMQGPITNEKILSFQGPEQAGNRLSHSRSSS